MSSELVYRMRTCAAAILNSQQDGDPWKVSGIIAADAANLLTEASNILDQPEPLGEAMEVIANAVEREVYRSSGSWIVNAELPEAAPRPCPTCGNISARKVRISHRKLLLTCPMCSHEWEYAP